MPQNVPQIPGKPYTFINKFTGEKDTVMLPKRRGASNADVYCIGGHWVSKRLTRLRVERKRNAKGPEGLLGRMKGILSMAACAARRGKYKAPSITALEAVKLWNRQKNKCAACGKNLHLFGSQLDHNHETGEVRGFLHKLCNRLEGEINKLKHGIDTVDLIRFTNWYRRTH